MHGNGVNTRATPARHPARPPTQEGELNLGPVSYLDCIVFCAFLAPQLVWQVGFFETAWCALQALPFLCECHPAHAASPAASLTGPESGETACGVYP